MSTHAHRASVRRLTAVLITTTLALALAVPAASAAPRTKLISQSSGGQQVPQGSYAPDIVRTGNTVVFSTVGKFAGVDANNSNDVYRRMAIQQKTKLVSQSYSGGMAKGSSAQPSISADGRYVVFESDAMNLTTTPVYSGDQIYRRSLLAGKTKLVSKGTAGAANKESGLSTVSATGRYVVFASSATNLTSKPTYGKQQVYLRDMKAGKLYLISKSGGSAGNQDSYMSSVSADGRFVVFGSSATNLTAKATYGVRQIYLRDRKLGKTYLISKSASGQAGKKSSRDPVISANGRIIAFASDASNLIPVGRDTNGFRDVYKYDRVKKKVSRVSLSWQGKQLKGGPSVDPDLSADGSIVVFLSYATNTIKGGVSGGACGMHIYRRGSTAGSLKLIDRSNKGAIANGCSMDPSVSANGKYVVFVSEATNLAKGGDSNGSTFDVFRRGPF